MVDLRHITFVAIVLIAGCDTCRGLDSVARPVPDAGTSNNAALDGGDSQDGDVGAAADMLGLDAGRSDVTIVPEGCPRTVADTPDWASFRALLPKLDRAPDGDELGYLPGAQLSLTASSPDADGQFGLVYVLDTGAESLARHVMFDADVAFDTRDTYELYDLGFEGIEWQQVTIVGDAVDAKRFQYAARGGAVDCDVDGISAAIGDFTTAEFGIQPGDTGLLIRECDDLAGDVGVAGVAGPTGRVFLMRSDAGRVATAVQVSGGETTEISGPPTGDWSNSLAASRRELALFPSITVNTWNAWFPLRQKAVQPLELGTRGDVAVEWLFEECHIAAGSARTSDAVAVSALDCAGPDCAVSTTNVLTDAAVEVVSVAAMPGGGFVVAYSLDGPQGGVFVRLFDDRFEPVVLPNANLELPISPGPDLIQDVGVAALADGEDIVVGVAFSTIDSAGAAEVTIQVGFLRLQKP